MRYKNGYFWFLWTGLVAYIISLNLPLISITKIYIFKNEVSLISMLKTLWHEEEWFLYCVIFCFVVLVPVCKFVMLIISAANPYFVQANRRAFYLLSLIGKWAMLDVFIAAVIIVIIKMDVMTQAHAKIGLYLFVYSIIASMVCTQMQKHQN